MANIVKQPCDEGVIRSAPCTVPCSRNVGRWVLAATILGSSMAMIDGTVVNVALPVLQSELKATSTDVQWIVESYALSGVADLGCEKLTRSLQRHKDFLSAFASLREIYIIKSLQKSGRKFVANHDVLGQP